MFIYDKAIRLLDSRITLDSPRRSEICCISHAHADHARKHGFVYATAPTLALMKSRLGSVQSQAADFGEKHLVDGYQISFHAAGHVMGSAQILIERDGHGLLYSGDFNAVATEVTEKLEIVACDTLIMECTFGHPRFVFPPRAELVERLCEWIAQTLQQGKVPVVFAYSLGKSQQAIRILSDNGFVVCAHETVAKLAGV